MDITRNLNMLLSVCVLASGITNAVSSELISHTPQLYIDVPSPNGKHFEKKALSLITSTDLLNCVPYLENIQRQLSEFFTKISPLQTKEDSKTTIRDQEKNEAIKTIMRDEEHDAIYDEEGWFLDDDLRNAQAEMSLLIDFAHRSCSINPTLEKVLKYLDSYYKDEGKSTEFIECTQFVINSVDKLDFSLISPENKKKLQQLRLCLNKE